MSLTYIFREDPNYRQNVTNSTQNPSVDRVVDRIHELAGEINALSKTVNRYGAGVGEKARLTVDHLNDNFQNLSKGAHSVADITTGKFGDFPVSPFYAFLICALIAIIFALCYFVSFGGHYYVEKRYQRSQQQSEDQEI